MTDREDIIIIGAGPAGLTAAYELVRKGRHPLVLEKRSEVGGLARTEIYKGFRFDIGGHRFFTKNEEIHRLWKEILGKDFIPVSRLSRIYFDDRYINYPLNFFNLLSNLGFLEGVVILLSFLKAKARFPTEEETSFEQWVTGRFGRRLYEKFFKTYTEKIWGIPCHQIRADWAAQRIGGLSLTKALTNAILGTNNSKSLISEFYYPTLGPGMMWRQLQKIVEDHGGRILFNAEVIRIHREGIKIRSVTIKKGKQTTEIDGRHFISSMPLSEFVFRSYPEPDDGVIEAAVKLTYRAFILVGLIIDRKDLFPDQWIYVHSPKVRVGRIQNFKNWSAAMVADPQKTGVGMEYFCAEGDDLWNMADSELIDMALQELRQLGVAESEEFIDGFVVRQANAYPVYDCEYHDHIKVIRDFLTTLENLQTIGRNGMHRYSNMDLSMESGILAAQNIFGANHDLWEKSREEMYLESPKKLKEEQFDPEKALMRTFARMDKLAFGTAVGSVSGLLFFLATIWLIIKGGEVVGPNLQLLSQYFIGYTVTVKGAFIAFGYSFFWGFLFGWLFANLRNLFLAIYIYRARKRVEMLSFRDFLDLY